MNGFLPDATELMQAMFEAQRAQIKVAEKMVQAGAQALDPAKREEAQQELREAGQEAVNAAQNWAQAQWEWLSLWRC